MTRAAALAALALLAGAVPARGQEPAPYPAPALEPDSAVSDSAQVLEELEATAAPRDPRTDITGFSLRKLGGRGYFITPKDIAIRRPYNISDALAVVPGMRVKQDGFGSVATSMRAEGTSFDDLRRNRPPCKPHYWVNGIPLPPEQDADLLIHPSEIHGIEVYLSVADAPPQYQRRGSRCGVILVWSGRH